MNELKWEAPPASNGRGGFQHRNPIADALRQSPGEWALISEGARTANQAAYIKAGKGRFAPRGSFEATSRRREDSRFNIYARYVGEVDA